MPDPLAHAERSALIDQLTELADAHPAERWIRWVLQLDARLRLLLGDVDGALARLGRLAELAGSDGDVVNAHSANYRLVLAATVAGDWDDARAAAVAVRASSNAALFDEATGAVAYSGMMRVVGMLEGSAPPPPPRMAMEWPTPEMDATAQRRRRVHAPRAAAAFTITRPGLIDRGAATHFACLAAPTIAAGPPHGNSCSTASRPANGTARRGWLPAPAWPSNEEQPSRPGEDAQVEPGDW